MAQSIFNIYVYAHWQGMPEAKMIGVWAAHHAKEKKAFNIEHDKGWIKSEQQLMAAAFMDG